MSSLITSFNIVRSLAWPAAWTCFASLSAGLLDHGVEALVTERLTLIECEPDVGNGMSIERLAEQCTVSRLPRVGIASECEIFDAWSKQRVQFTKRVMPIAAPSVVRGVLHHGRPYRVELDVSLTGDKVVLGLNEGGFVAAIP